MHIARPRRLNRLKPLKKPGPTLQARQYQVPQSPSTMLHSITAFTHHFFQLCCIRFVWLTDVFLATIPVGSHIHVTYFLMTVNNPCDD